MTGVKVVFVNCDFPGAGRPIRYIGENPRVVFRGCTFR